MARTTPARERDRLIGLSASFFVLFFAFYASQTQVTPTLGDFGSLSLGLLYGCLALAAPFAPAVLRCLSCGEPRVTLAAETRALALASFGYVPFMIACADSAQHVAQLAGSAVLGMAAALLWVAEGSLLTASTNEANRGRWSGIFWSIYMAGNACGNFSATVLVRATSVSTMFLALAGVGSASTLSFVLFVRPRRSNALSPSAYTIAEPLVPPSTSDGVDEPGRDRGRASQSLANDLRELLLCVARQETLALLPLLLFIGAENAFWSGEFASLGSRLGGPGAAGLLVGTLAATEIVASVAAGVAVDRKAPTLGLAVGAAAFCAGLAIVQFSLVPQLPTPANSTSEHGAEVREGGGGETMGLGWPAYLAAALMGVGDAAANTVAVARLGSLADEFGLISREAAFQYFQVANVAMTALAFVYAPAMPLSSGGPPLQPAILCGLALVAVGTFACGKPRRGEPMDTLDEPWRPR
jgi:hypothetical protein